MVTFLIGLEVLNSKGCIAHFNPRVALLNDMDSHTHTHGLRCMQEMLTPSNCIISEVGDSWFNSQKLKLPRGCAYEMQVGFHIGLAPAYMYVSKCEMQVITAGEAIHKVLSGTPENVTVNIFNHLICRWGMRDEHACWVWSII